MSAAATRTRPIVHYALAEVRMRWGRWGRIARGDTWHYGYTTPTTWTVRTVCHPDSVLVEPSRSRFTKRFEKTTCRGCLEGIADKVVFLMHLAETGELYVVAPREKKEPKRKKPQRRRRRLRRGSVRRVPPRQRYLRAIHRCKR